MTQQEILRCVDHTLLAQTATWAEIQTICDDGARYGVASVCIPPCYVRQAAGYLGGRVPVCTVVGFPNGNSTTAAKVFEAREAIQNGASEIDMVINLGWLRDGDFAQVEKEIRALKDACGERILKVIIETCLLTREEKMEMCRIVTAAGADFIKTSTGYGTRGASQEDIRLFRKYLKKPAKIKASGGIRTAADAKAYIALGCSRLGTSNGREIVEGTEAKEAY